MIRKRMLELAVASILAAGTPALAAARDGGTDAPRERELEPSMVSDLVKAHLRGVQACYEVGLKGAPSLQGLLVAVWTINLDGGVTGVRWEKDTLRDPAVAACVAALIKTWRFAKPGARTVDVSFPFVFSPDRAEPPGAVSHAKPASAAEDSPERNQLELGGGAALTATLTGVDQQNEGQRPHLKIVIERAGRATDALELDFTKSKYPDLADVLEPTFFWSVESTVADLGPRRVARVGLVGRTGEDLTVIQEIAVLVEIEAEPKVLWIGRGDREENQFDACIIVTNTYFRMPGPGTLERRSRSTKTVSRPTKGDPAEDYRKRCKAPPPRRDVFQVGGG